MKKIVGILAVAALFATSVFASDISAATKIKGTIFSRGADETVGLFQQKNDSHDYANPNFSVSISDDNFGASLKITTDGDKGSGVDPFWAPVTKQTTQTIWFKPVDALKISVGNYDLALNKEQIDWTESVTGLGGNGFVFSINAAGVGLDFFLNEGTGNDFWFSKAKNADDPTLKEFGVKFGYSADFGSIGAFVDINRSGNRWTYHDGLTSAYADAAKYGVDDKGNPKTGILDPKAEGAIKNMLFGAGYNNTFGGVKTFLNVVGYMGENFDWIRPELYVSGAADAFGYSLFAAPVIWTNSDLNKDFEMELVAKVTYALDGFTPYAYFKANNLLADTFAATVKLGANGSVGGMGWNTWLQLDVADKTAISVPFELTVGF